MTDYIALLRGINVGGNKKIQMARLKECLSEAGLKDVKTYINSGNVIFRSGARSEGTLEKKIADVIQDEWGFEVAVVVRTCDNVEALLKNDPFAKQTEAKDLKVYLTFFSKKIAAAAKRELTKDKIAHEQVAVIDREIFILRKIVKAGEMHYENRYLEQATGQPSTTRTRSTIQKLLKLKAS